MTRHQCYVSDAASFLQACSVTSCRAWAAFKQFTPCSPVWTCASKFGQGVHAHVQSQQTSCTTARRGHACAAAGSRPGVPWGSVLTNPKVPCRCRNPESHQRCAQLQCWLNSLRRVGRELLQARGVCAHARAAVTLLRQSACATEHGRRQVLDTLCGAVVPHARHTLQVWAIKLLRIVD